MGGEVVELIGGLDRLTERKVTGQSFTGTIITDAAAASATSSEHRGRPRRLQGVGTIVEVPNQPGEGEDIFREDLALAQGTLHLVTTNLDQVGAILTVIIYFRSDIRRLASAWLRGLVNGKTREAPDYRFAWYVILGLIPIGIVRLF